MHFDENEHVHFSQMTILNNLIREIKLRELKLEKTRLVENILTEIK
ncbi:hypothetical protein DW1_0927 [Proteiniborus sp. DW1]|nr:hypothetical protein [Proteiniborus sp. DW1]SCG82534.1 hypothetical protein DW1_0927 [Proteiniborus sp. DW1]